MLIGATRRSQLPDQWVGILDGVFAITLTFLGITLPDYIFDALSEGFTLRSGILVFFGFLRFWVVFLVLYDIWHISRQSLVHAMALRGRSHNYYGLLFLFVTILPVLVSVRGNLLLKSIREGASLSSSLSFFILDRLPAGSTVFIDVLTVLMVSLSYWLVYLTSREHESSLALDSSNDCPSQEDSRHFFALHRPACSLRLLFAFSLLFLSILQLPFQGFPVFRLCMLLVEVLLALMLVSPLLPKSFVRSLRLLSPRIH